MMFYLLEWVKLQYSLSTFCFPAPSRNHLWLCFLGNVAYFIEKKTDSQFCCLHMGFWAAYVFVYHTLNSRPPFDFLHRAEQFHSNFHSKFNFIISHPNARMWFRYEWCQSWRFQSLFKIFKNALHSNHTHFSLRSPERSCHVIWWILNNKIPYLSAQRSDPFRSFRTIFIQSLGSSLHSVNTYWILAISKALF